MKKKKKLPEWGDTDSKRETECTHLWADTSSKVKNKQATITDPERLTKNKNNVSILVAWISQGKGMGENGDMRG